MAATSSAATHATPSSSRQAPNRLRQSQAHSLHTPQSSAAGRGGGERGEGGEGGGGRGRILTLPPYEAQVAELNLNARRTLQGVANSTITRNLRAQLTQVSKALTENAGHANDGLVDAKQRYEKRKRKRQGKTATEGGDDDDEDGGDEDASGDKDGDKNKDEEEQRRLEELERRVKEATDTIEEKVRGVVDSEVRIDTMIEILGKMGQGDAAVSSDTRRSRSTRAAIRAQRENGGEDPDDEADGEPQGSVAEQVIPASHVLDAGLSEKMDHWNGLSMTERYGTNDRYTAFKRMIHESQYTGQNIPPLPSPATWFRTSEHDSDEAEAPESPSHQRKLKHAQQEQQQRQRREGAAGDDEAESEETGADDVAISSEKVSLQCPITFLRFKDPVSSTKCPHSFERKAIEDMIRRRGGGTRGNRGRGGLAGRVRCPVCTVQLTLNDLKSDPILIRRVRRANEMDERDEENDDEIGYGSEEEDGDADVMLQSQRRRKKSSLAIKTEKVMSPSRERNMVPDTQFDAVSDDNSAGDGDDDAEEA